jgi:hypothetical protein
LKYIIEKKIVLNKLYAHIFSILNIAYLTFKFNIYSKTVT